MQERNNLFEAPKEYVSPPEEVEAVLCELIKGEYHEERRCEDEKGLYYLEVTAPGESEGEVNEYIYSRKGTYPECLSTVTDINVVYYSGGQPMGGDTVAKYRNGSWMII